VEGVRNVHTFLFFYALESVNSYGTGETDRQIDGQDTYSISQPIRTVAA